MKLVVIRSMPTYRTLTIVLSADFFRGDQAMRTRRLSTSDDLELLQEDFDRASKLISSDIEIAEQIHPQDVQRYKDMLKEFEGYVDSVKRAPKFQVWIQKVAANKVITESRCRLDGCKKQHRPHGARRKQLFCKEHTRSINTRLRKRLLTDPSLMLAPAKTVDKRKIAA